MAEETADKLEKFSSPSFMNEKKKKKTGHKSRSHCAAFYLSVPALSKHSEEQTEENAAIISLQIQHGPRLRLIGL